MFIIEFPDPLFIELYWHACDSLTDPVLDILNYQTIIKFREGVIESLPHLNNGVRISEFGLGSTGV